jgi:hypothetical protein
MNTKSGISNLEIPDKFTEEDMLNYVTVCTLDNDATCAYMESNKHCTTIKIDCMFKIKKLES